MVVDFDDFGANHIISDQCQSHDCRDKLDALHYANPAFKVTLFTIPAELTYELAEWCKANNQWVELAVHGIKHRDNYECSQMSYEEFDTAINSMQPMIDTYFVKGFKAPGWQISDDIYRWLKDHGWWVADQSYNNDRRTKELRAYVNNNGSFSVQCPDKMFEVASAWHGHTWNCVGNGIYETYEQVEGLVRNASEFKFISEVLA